MALSSPVTGMATCPWQDVRVQGKGEGLVRWSVKDEGEAAWGPIIPEKRMLLLPWGPWVSHRGLGNVLIWVV